MSGIIVILVPKDKKLSSHMAKISKHIIYLNHKIYSHDQMSKMIVNLGTVMLIEMPHFQYIYYSSIIM